MDVMGRVVVGLVTSQNQHLYTHARWSLYLDNSIFKFAFTNV
jgi:hypothetical protein